MTVETIPSELVDILRGEIGAAMDVTEDGTAMSDPNLELAVEGVVQAAIRVLTDRSTRPAEPAPEVEVGDGEVVAWRRRRKGCVGAERTWTMCPMKPERDREFDLEPLVRLSTLEAERARADAAEQRAADALARAEKAEGTLEARDLLWRRKDFGRRWTAKTPFGSYFIDASDEPYEWAFGEGDFRPVGSVEEAKAAALADFKTRVRSCLLPVRASREAQPATDGGDNG